MDAADVEGAEAEGVEAGSTDPGGPEPDGVAAEGAVSDGTATCPTVAPTPRAADATATTASEVVHNISPKVRPAGACLGPKSHRREARASTSQPYHAAVRRDTLRAVASARQCLLSVTQAPITDSEARTLAESLNRLSGSHPAAAAQTLVDTALARAPGHPVVLNSLAGYLQRAGRPAEARRVYERALGLDPNAKVLWLNLATTCRSLGDTAGESHALEKALALEPRYVAALLHKGDLQERLGRPKAAVQVFEAALHSIPPGETIPAHMAAAVAHARDVVGANSRALEAFIERELEPIRRQHSAADQHRYEACQDILLGKRRAYSSLPKDTFFPYLPAIEFFPRESFPWLSTLEAATEDIAAEARAALEQHWAEFAPYVNFPPGTPIDNWAPLNHSRDWSVYPLWHDSEPLPDHQRACPKTTAVLAQLPLCDIPGYAPGAFFSVLQPRTRLPPHCGTTNTRSIVHLPLVIPQDCRFRVGAQTRAWEKGRAWVFDDTIEHEAWNDSQQVRIILIFDIWNPLLTGAERDLVRAMTVARGRFYGADAPTMGSR